MLNETFLIILLIGTLLTLVMLMLLFVFRVVSLKRQKLLILALRKHLFAQKDVHDLQKTLQEIYFSNMRCEKALLRLNEQQQSQPAQATPVVVTEDETEQREMIYTKAKQFLRQGLSVDDVIKRCQVSRDEVQMLQAFLHAN